MALVRIARLENLHEIGDLIARLAALEAGLPPPPGGGKKKLTAPAHEPAAATPSADTQATAAPALDHEVIRKLWPDLIKKVGVRIGVPLSRLDPPDLACAAPDLLVIRVGAGYNWVADECDAPEPRARIEKELRKLLDRPVTVRFERSEIQGTVSAPETPAAPTPGRPGDPNGDPTVQKVAQLFEARLVHLEVDEGPEGPA